MSKVTMQDVFVLLKEGDDAQAKEKMREFIIQRSRDIHENIMEASLSEDDVLTAELEDELEDHSDDLEAMDSEVNAEEIYDDEEVEDAVDDLESGEDAIEQVEDRVDDIDDKLEMLRKEFEEFMADEEAGEEESEEAGEEEAGEEAGEEEAGEENMGDVEDEIDSDMEQIEDEEQA